MQTLRALLSRHIHNNQPNPVHVSIANKGYDIQFHTLHIPDRLGFFSPASHPDFQVHEVGALIFMVLLTVVGAVMAVCLVLMFRLLLRWAWLRALGMGAFFLSCTILMVALFGIGVPVSRNLGTLVPSHESGKLKLRME
jgi:hypothetical protein